LLMAWTRPKAADRTKSDGPCHPEVWLCTRGVGGEQLDLNAVRQTSLGDDLSPESVATHRYVDQVLSHANIVQRPLPAFGRSPPSASTGFLRIRPLGPEAT
jgi:hypothetical protein